MSVLTSEEVALLVQIAALRADKARSMIASAQRRIDEIDQSMKQFQTLPTATDPAAGVTFAKWMDWRDNRLAQANRELALALAALSAAQISGAKKVAREEVLKDLLAKTVASESRLSRSI